jgi:methionyl-tRNA formyltransferase
MTTTVSPKVIFFGNERLATGVTTTAPTLNRLLDAGYDVAAVVSHDSGSRSRKQRNLEIAEVAAEHNIPVLLPIRPAEIIDQLKGYNAEIAILVAYGKIVPQSIIDVFPHGIINIHPSLLPLHRGPSPIESVILAGAPETGVSVMQLVAGMDAGPVYGQTSIKLHGTESKQQLANTLLEAGGELIVRSLPSILDGSLRPAAQNDDRATYDSLITKTDGELDFQKPSQLLVREIRAYLNWPKSRTTINGIEVIITAATAEPVKLDTAIPGDIQVVLGAGSIFICTSNGSLSVKRLKPSGKQEMSVRAFLAGYGHVLAT